MKKKISSFILILLVVLVIGGVSYAFFNYFMEGKNSVLISGDIYMTLSDGEDEINIPNIFPETVMEARSSERHNSEDNTNNILTFLVKGNNDTEDVLYYEILLNEGDEMEEKTRFNPEHLVFDLIEVVDNEEVLLQDAISYNELNNTKIWVDKVDSGDSVDKIYKLRMWLSDEVTFGYGEGVTYDQEDYVNRYASVKIAVRADLEKKSFPSVIHTNDDYVENGVSYFRVNLSNDYLLEEEGNLLEENDEVRIVITNPENKLDFTYKDSEGNEEETKSSSIDKTYTYNKNKTITMVVYTQSKNDTNVSTTLNFKIYKNNELIQEYNKKVNVVGNNYCLNNGFTKLADCILVTENLAKSVNDAKTYINSKGTPNVNETAPTYVYVEEQTENVEYTGSSGLNTWYFGTHYEFNNVEGTFRLYNNSLNDTLSKEPLSNDYVGYYTCGESSGGYYTCNTIYKILSVEIDNNKIYGTKITYRIMSSLDSQVGLYKVIDDLGDSYIFRGNVNNNNVSFAGDNWKIIRINGDGSIRMIFDGNTSFGKARIGRSAYNKSGSNPSNVGYMYNESDEPVISNYNFDFVFKSAVSYYWGEDYTYERNQDGVMKFKLAVGENNYPLVSKTLLEMKNDNTNQLTKTPYTCILTSDVGECEVLYKVNSIASATSANVNTISVTFNNKALNEENNKDSEIKSFIDNWYSNTFSAKTNNGHNVTDYLYDGIFCNDRSTISVYTKGAYLLSNPYISGYLLSEYTHYSSYIRLASANIPYKTATLVCENKNNSFTITESSKTNGSLTYPIGLISVDEVALAGGVFNVKNVNYYLNSTHQDWTLSPVSFINDYLISRVFVIDGNGSIMINSNGVTQNNFSVRPVINLNKDVTINDGDGTASNPYMIY